MVLQTRRKKVFTPAQLKKIFKNRTKTFKLNLKKIRSLNLQRKLKAIKSRKTFKRKVKTF